MEKYLLISISIALVIPPITPHDGEYCLYNDGGFEVCRYYNIIESVTRTNGTSQHLALNLDDFIEIAPHAFNNVTILTFELSYPEPKNCTPKFIQLTPESFDGLTGVENLQLDCVRFPVKPNPFKHLQSLRSLKMSRLDFAEFGHDFVADFPHLTKLILTDVGIPIISPDTFSNVSDGLTILYFHGISVIEPGSFKRFHNVIDFGVSKSMLEDLPYGIFDGFDQMQSLFLVDNKIQVVSSVVFAGLTHLVNLTLSQNRISHIERMTFFSMNLSEIFLDHNNLKEIPFEVFCWLDNLEYLDLSFNEIGFIASKSFWKCPRLRALDLDDNAIHYIEPEAFAGLNLDWLSMVNNKISVLGSNSFSGLHVNKELFLTGNDIKEIEPLAFGNFTAKWVGLCYSKIVRQRDLAPWGIVENSIEEINSIRVRKFPFAVMLCVRERKD